MCATSRATAASAIRRRLEEHARTVADPTGDVDPPLADPAGGGRRTWAESHFAISQASYALDWARVFARFARLASSPGRKKRTGRPEPPLAAVRSPSLAEQVLRHARRAEDEVARVLQFAAQPAQVYVEQLSFPFAHLAGDDHGLDIAALHHLHDSTRYVVDREHVDMRGVEDDDIGLLAGRERAGLAVQSKVFRTVDGGVAQHVPHVEERHRAWRQRRPR